MEKRISITLQSIFYNKYGILGTGFYSYTGDSVYMSFPLYITEKVYLSDTHLSEILLNLFKNQSISFNNLTVEHSSISEDKATEEGNISDIIKSKILLNNKTLTRKKINKSKSFKLINKIKRSFKNRTTISPFRGTEKPLYKSWFMSEISTKNITSLLYKIVNKETLPLNASNTLEINKKDKSLAQKTSINPLSIIINIRKKKYINTIPSIATQALALSSYSKRFNSWYSKLFNRTPVTRTTNPILNAGKGLEYISNKYWWKITTVISGMLIQLAGRLNKQKVIARRSVRRETIGSPKAQIRDRSYYKPIREQVSTSLLPLNFNNKTNLLNTNIYGVTEAKLVFANNKSKYTSSNRKGAYTITLSHNCKGLSNRIIPLNMSSVKLN
jgi:hypothetical protein